MQLWCRTYKKIVRPAPHTSDTIHRADWVHFFNKMCLCNFCVMLINIINTIAILNQYNLISTTLELITLTKPKFNWGTTIPIELGFKNLVQCENGFEAAITNLKLYNITNLCSLTLFPVIWWAVAIFLLP